MEQATVSFVLGQQRQRIISLRSVILRDPCLFVCYQTRQVFECVRRFTCCGQRVNKKNGRLGEGNQLSSRQPSSQSGSSVTADDSMTKNRGLGPCWLISALCACSGPPSVRKFFFYYYFFGSRRGPVTSLLQLSSILFK